MYIVYCILYIVCILHILYEGVKVINNRNIQFIMLQYCIVEREVWWLF